MEKNAIRHDWTPEEILELLKAPLKDLFTLAKDTHKSYGDQDIQKAVLLSVKTGACPEDCGYCSQSAHYQTGLEPEALLSKDKVMLAARAAKDSGAHRFCMGAAWRDLPSDKRFDHVLNLVKDVATLGMEVCCTMGMASFEQLEKLKEAGLTAYNHNLDTSKEHYSKIISTRSYEDRLTTLFAARKAKVQICCGGILGLGESLEDRASMLVELSRFNPHPESVPINRLVATPGTPLQSQKPIEFEEFLRMIAVTRIVMPRTRVRLSAGRNELTQEQQLLCFEVGANSIFMGDKLLTAPNVAVSQDQELEQRWLEKNQSMGNRSDRRELQESSCC